MIASVTCLQYPLGGWPLEICLIFRAKMQLNLSMTFVDPVFGIRRGKASLYDFQYDFWNLDETVVDFDNPNVKWAGISTLYVQVCDLNFSAFRLCLICKWLSIFL